MLFHLPTTLDIEQYSVLLLLLTAMLPLLQPKSVLTFFKQPYVTEREDWFRGKATLPSLPIN